MTSEDLYSKLRSEFTNCRLKPQEFDLRTEADRNRLVTALMPFKERLEMARELASHPTLSKPLMLYTGNNADELATVGRTVRTVTRLLNAEARLSAVLGDSILAESNFRAVVQVAGHLGQEMGSLLQSTIRTAVVLPVLRNMRMAMVDSGECRVTTTVFACLSNYLTEIPNHVPAVKHELLAFDNQPDARSIKSSFQRRDAKRVLEVLETPNQGSAETVKRLLRLAGAYAIPEKSRSPYGATFRQQALTIYKHAASAASSARLSVVFFKSLYQQETTGLFPADLPLKGSMAEDTFTGAKIRYELTSTGFRVEAKGSESAFLETRPEGNSHLNYPVQYYANAVL